MKKVQLFTDGACSGNPGPGGWGALLRYNGHEREMGGGAADTTNNRMEMTAVIEGLAALKSPCAVTLYTDSKYVMDGVTKYLDGWKRRGWKTADKKEVKNRDLWERLESEMARHRIEWVWVKGHAGHAENERVDQIARDNIPPRAAEDQTSAEITTAEE
jgi:ribonuclease HI